MVLGWDISTSIIGVTVLDLTGKYVNSSHLDMRKLSDLSLIDKAEETEWWVREVLTDHVGDGHFVHYIEDRLGNFAAGRTMLQTLMKLAAFNMVVSYMIYKESLQVKGAQSVFLKHIHPSTVKAVMKSAGLVIPKGADKKQLTLDYVRKVEPTFPVELNKNDKPQPWCFDKADSYIIAKAGLRKFKNDAT